MSRVSFNVKTALSLFDRRFSRRDFVIGPRWSGLDNYGMYDVNQVIEAIAEQQQHPHHQLRIDRRPADVAVEACQLFRADQLAPPVTIGVTLCSKRSGGMRSSKLNKEAALVTCLSTYHDPPPPLNEPSSSSESCRASNHELFSTASTRTSRNKRAYSERPDL